MGGGRGGKLVSLMIFSLPPCGVCRSPVPSVYSINYKRKKKNMVVVERKLIVVYNEGVRTQQRDDKEKVTPG